MEFLAHSRGFWTPYTGNNPQNGAAATAPSETLSLPFWVRCPFVEPFYGLTHRRSREDQTFHPFVRIGDDCLRTPEGSSSWSRVRIWTLFSWRLLQFALTPLGYPLLFSSSHKLPAHPLALLTAFPSPFPAFFLQPLFPPPFYTPAGFSFPFRSAASHNPLASLNPPASPASPRIRRRLRPVQGVPSNEAKERAHMSWDLEVYAKTMM